MAPADELEECRKRLFNHISRVLTSWRIRQSPGTDVNFHLSILSSDIKRQLSTTTTTQEFVDCSLVYDLLDTLWAVRSSPSRLDSKVYPSGRADALKILDAAVNVKLDAGLFKAVVIAILGQVDPECEPEVSLTRSTAKQTVTLHFSNVFAPKHTKRDDYNNVWNLIDSLLGNDQTLKWQRKTRSSSLTLMAL